MSKLIARNPTAKHNYNIIDTIETGIVLSGTEIKSIRNGELFIYNLHISPYEFGNIYNKDPLRDRKLLLNKKEINKLIGKIQTKGYTLVPVSLYFKGSIVKLELGIGKGKKLYDKREDLAKKDAERRIMQALKSKV